MARIRTIKPDFFRHEELFEAEKKSGLPLRVAFAGLFTVADREGRFKWKPNQLKFDVLPYDDVDFEKVLEELCRFEFITRYEIDGKVYAWIPTFTVHQVINNKESKSNIPEPPPIKDASFTRGSRVFDGREGKEGKGKEGNTQVCGAIGEIFGREYEANPEDRMPALSGWYRDIEAQAEKLLEVHSPEIAVKQIQAYLKHCNDTKRKVIGTPHKVAETILTADWVSLRAPEQVARGDPYSEARHNKTLWTEDAWREYYKKQIKTDVNFRKVFQITQT